ncbi:TetR/AcrR family transcriptional regulator [Saccharicrinis sp. FJH62]|uniref:TetR/AcrR family transcriptional regulator n=1 Tax=Saccharicrinis sp. FJH62 TaxID=3344657 RepID=UPI0035D4667B
MSDHKSNPKYKQIVETAHDLFWKFGIKRVTIEEICSESGVSKMTFYRFFPNKIELAKVVISTLFEKVEKDYKALMSRDIPFEEKIKEQVRLKFEGTVNISEAFVADVYSGWNDELKAFFNEITIRMVNMVRDDYVKAQKKGAIRKDVNIDFIFYLSNKMTEMVSDPQLIAMYNNNVQHVIMEFINMMFYGIIPRKDE